METAGKNRTTSKKILIVEDHFIEAYNLQLILEKAGHKVIGIARSVIQAMEFIEESKPDLVFVDIVLKGKETGIDLAYRLIDLNIGFIYLSANSDKSILDKVKMSKPYGFIIKPFREQEILITVEIACYRHNNSIETSILQEAEIKKSIDNINTGLKWDQAILELGKILQPYIPFEYLDAGLSSGNFVGLLRKNYETYDTISEERFAKINNLKKNELAKINANSLKMELPEIFFGTSFQKISKDCTARRLVLHSFGIKSFLAFPILLPDNNLFNIFFYSRNPDIYNKDHIIFLNGIKNLLSKFIENWYGKTEEENVSNKELFASPEILGDSQKSSGFEGMIGHSKKMIQVFDYIKKVAPSETSVLILGESGTGKEKVAQAIHNLSARKGKPFVVVNCGAIPQNLAESLLFGHIKGSFTGALTSHNGKFEMADGGTIFLDEIGELPLDLQVKLLRVLQEKEIEKIGTREPVKVDVRIIAATNRDLEEEVASGRFRLDLYYRLYVFPILIPTLRERKEDVPALAEHFAKSFSKGDITSLSDRILTQLNSYDWPGNIRELEHVIQRSILLAEGKTLTEIMLPSIYKTKQNESQSEYTVKSYYDNERDYIVYILKKCGGKVAGTGGAAEILGIPSSTLNSKLKKLGIKLAMITSLS